MGETELVRAQRLAVAAAELARTARGRLIDTFADRARQLLDLVGVGPPITAPAA